MLLSIKCLERTRNDAGKDVFKKKISLSNSAMRAPPCGNFIFYGNANRHTTACRRLIVTTTPLRFPSFLVKIVLTPSPCAFQKGIMSKISLRAES